MKPLDSDKKPGKAPEAPAEAIPETAPAAEEKIDFSNVQIEPLFADTVDFETFSRSDFRAVKVLACEAVPKSKKLLKFTLDDGTGENRTILSGIHAYYEPEELVGKTCIAITNLPPRPMMGIESCGMLISAVHQENGEEKIDECSDFDGKPQNPRQYGGALQAGDFRAGGSRRRSALCDAGGQEHRALQGLLRLPGCGWGVWVRAEG